MSKLSVITINYNNSIGLEKTVRSIVGQSFKDFEFIIIDGGSNDGSVDVIKKYSHKISFWVSEKDKGIYNAQNKGIEKATGEYCLFLNSGDYLVDDNVFQNVFSTNLKHDIIYGDMVIIDPSDEKMDFKMPDHIGVRQMLADTLWHPVSFIKRELFSKYGNYNEIYKIVADYDFFVRVIIGKKVSSKHLPIKICVFDRTGISSDKSKMSELAGERKKIQDLYFSPLLLLLFRMYSKLRN